MILNILTVYNEIKFMPLKKKWCEDNGLELYVIDNYSNDGTWEWLQENNISSHRLDTKGAFDLTTLQSEMQKVIHRLKPEWFIYNGADLYPVMRERLCDGIMAADREGYNAIRMRWAMFYNTGEVMEEFDPFHTYYYYRLERPIVLIAKYNPSFSMSGDDIHIPTPRIKDVSGLILNYGHTKSRQEREETYARRKLAWARGLPKAWGVHYKEGEQRNWIWNKEELQDIRKGEYSWIKL